MSTENPLASVQGCINRSNARHKGMIRQDVGVMIICLALALVGTLISAVCVYFHTPALSLAICYGITGFFVLWVLWHILKVLIHLGNWMYDVGKWMREV